MSATIKIAGKAAVIGPDDVLVVNLDETPEPDVLNGWRDALNERLPGRWILVAGNGIEITKAEGLR